MTLNADQIIALDHFLQSDKNTIYKCPNDLTKKTLEAHRNGIECNRCDFKVKAENISPVLFETSNLVKI